MKILSIPILAMLALAVGACGSGGSTCEASYDAACGSTPTRDQWTCGTSTFLLECQREADGPNPPYSCSCSENGAQTGSTHVVSLSCGPSDIAVANAGCGWDIK